MKNWKTTSSGILLIVGAIATIVYQHNSLSPELIMGAATAILGGIGLIFAKDSGSEVATK